MGTPDFSVNALDAIVKAGHEVVCVFSQPDKPKGRKMELVPTPVKQYAVDNNIPIYQPITVRDGDALEIFKKYNPDIAVVVAYGKILPKEILEYPKYGCVNLHASLLPKFRGASPIQWAIVCGEDVTGVSTMYMDEGMDTGDVILTETIKISEDDTAESLFDKLSKIGSRVLCNTLTSIENGTAVATKQDENSATYAPIIKKEMGLIDFNKTSREINSQIRGLYPWPGAYFFRNNKRIKVLESKIIDSVHDCKIGEVIENNDCLHICCGGGSVIGLTKVQPEGKKAMTISEFLNGNKIEKGSIVFD